MGLSLAAPAAPNRKAATRCTWRPRHLASACLLAAGMIRAEVRRCQVCGLPSVVCLAVLRSRGHSRIVFEHLPPNENRPRGRP